MSRISSSPISNTNQSALSSADAINDLDLSAFLDLMIVELQNQDPLNPLDNKDMLAQISQIREVGATDKLIKTLDSVLLGQNIASATNLIGADITALSDDSEAVEGIVNRISIEKGVPKLHVDLTAEAAASDEPGRVDPGKHSYRIVWEDGDKLIGLEFSGTSAVTTTEDEGAVIIRNLPKTASPKQVYRTDASGSGDYKLVGTITDGSKGSFVDTLADENLSETRQTRPFSRSAVAARSYQVGLNNVSGVRPPKG
jgi:hypothetical protein